MTPLVRQYAGIAIALVVAFRSAETLDDVF